MRRGCFDCADELVGLWKELEVIWKKTHQTGAKKQLVNIKRNPALNDHEPVKHFEYFHNRYLNCINVSRFCNGSVLFTSSGPVFEIW